MNILMLHNGYRIRGGEDESFETECRILRDAGHFVKTIHVHNNNFDGGSVKVALRSIWSWPSYDLVDRHLRRRRFDVMHVQNFFPVLSPSVYSAAKKHGVAVVQSLRNYRLLCPNSFLFRDGHVCESCLGKTFKYPSVLHACYRNSRLASVAVAAMCGVHASRGTWHNDVDLYISLTDFARNKYLQSGLRPEKIVTKGNCVDPDPGIGQGNGGFVLFVGRLSPEKGLGTLLSAWSRVDPRWVLKIAGEGPLSEKLRAQTRDQPNVEWLGLKSSSEVKNLLGEAKVTVICSEWYETFGRVAIESFAKGTPVIASRIGALAEVVKDRTTGLLFRAGDPEDLAAQIKWCFDRPREMEALRLRAREEYEQNYTARTNCEKLLEFYGLAQTLARKIAQPAPPSPYRVVL